MLTTLSLEIDAPVEAVWAEAIDFGSHHEWMSDALQIDFATEQRAGVGTVLLVETKVGPFRTLDRFTITEVEAPRLVRGRHEGVVSGSAHWTRVGSNATTTFTWEERLRFPWFFGGRIGEIVAKPILSAMWQRNLQRLKSRIERR